MGGFPIYFFIFERGWLKVKFSQSIWGGGWLTRRGRLARANTVWNNVICINEASAYRGACSSDKETLLYTLHIPYSLV